MKNAGFGEKEMIDKELFKLIGKNKKYIFIAVLLQVIGLIANVGITASICWAIYLAFTRSESVMYSYPAICALIGIIVRYIMTRLTGDMKDVLGRKVKKDLRERTYNKIVKLGVRSTDRMSMAGLTQVSMEGVEQLDLYYSSYLPQFFFAMLAPVILFLICVWIDWRTALVLLVCVPLIPVSIVAVSKYAKKIFAKYWGKYTSMGDKFLDSVQGLKELKIFKADAKQHEKMNEERGGVSQNHDESSRNATCQYNHNGLGRIRRCGCGNRACDLRYGVLGTRPRLRTVLMPCRGRVFFTASRVRFGVPRCDERSKCGQKNHIVT